jgi:hypothetical protein
VPSKDFHLFEGNIIFPDPWEDRWMLFRNKIDRGECLCSPSGTLIGMIHFDFQKFQATSRPMRVAVNLSIGVMIALGGGLPAQTIGGDLYAYHTQIGAHPEENAGSAVAKAGDIDGDGICDYIIGRRGYEKSGVGEVGAVQVYSGADNRLVFELIGVELGTRFGNVVAGVGDVNSDGVPDFAAGMPFFGTGSFDGRVHIYSGADASILYQLDGNSGDLFGMRVAAAGDVNLDGYADFLVGAPGEDRGATVDVGAVHLYSGKTGSLYRRWKGKYYHSSVGHSIAGGGDLNADGVPDILFGDPDADGNGGVLFDGGVAYAYSGADNALLYEIRGDARNVQLGISVCFAGDVNEDGFDDFWVGDQRFDFQGLYRAGAAWRYSGKSGVLQQEIGGKGISEEFACNMAGGEDFDGDGKLDVAIGVQGAAKPSGNAGAIRVFSKGSDQHIMEFRGRGSGEKVGSVMCALSDVIPDGQAEILIGIRSRDSDSDANNGTLHGWFGILGDHPFLHSSASEISASAGGTVELNVDFSTVQALRPYRVLGSASGEGPFSYWGIQIPLTPGDSFWDLMLRPWPPVFLQNAFGYLGEDGTAVCTWQLPPNAIASYVGTTFSFAAIVQRKGGNLLSSVAVNVKVVP